MRNCVFLTIALASLFCAGMCSAADLPREAPAADSWTVLLSGQWEFAPPDSTAFKPIKVPGVWSSSPDCADYKMSQAWRTGTYRREFTVPEGMTGAAVEFDSIRWGGEVLVNGKSAGKYDLGFSQVAFDVGALIQPGVNRLEVKPVGWSAIERFEGGGPKIPVGAGNWFGNKSAGITGDVFLRFHKGARVASVQVHPRVKGPACDLHVEVAAGGVPWKGRLCAQIVTDDGKQAVSAAKSLPVTLSTGATAAMVLKDVQAPGAKLWFPESPALHRAVVWLETEGDKPEVASVREETFGFREVAVKDGRFLLNGRPISLFGATGVWIYGDYDFMANDEWLKNYQVTFFRAMNGAAFRSHQDPLARKWIDLCDRSGILIFCEFPNFPDVQPMPLYGLQNPYDQPVFWQNLQREIRGLVACRMNHPSIVAWSASNEGNGFGDWERANLVPFVKSVDATRPVMLSADVTDDFVDQHNFFSNWFATQVDFERAIADLKRFYPGRVLGCSEFAQYQAGAMYYGPEQRPRGSPEVAHDAALILAEQVEALRRERFTLIMPFSVPLGGAPKSGKIEDVPEGFYALRNALAPLAVSLDLSRRHATAGTKTEFPVWVMSDSETASGSVRVDVLLLAADPGFKWDGRTDGLTVVSKTSFKTRVKAWDARREVVTLRMPAKAGDYTVAAVLQKDGAAATTSLRPLRVYEPLPAALKPLTVGVIEKDGKIERWLKSRGHRVVLAYGGERPDVIVVGEGLVNDGRLRSWGFNMEERVRRYGTRLVILEQQAWNPEAFPLKLLEGLTASALRVPIEPLHPDKALENKLGTYLDFRRLNGMEGVGLRVRLEPPEAAAPVAQGGGTGQPDSMIKPAEPVPAPAKNPWTPWILAYSRGEKKPDWALVQRRVGAGEIYACQIPVAARLDAGNPAEFDPLVERLFALLVEGQSLAPAEPAK